MIKTIKEIDQFTGRVRTNGDSLCVTIPLANVEFAGIKAGDMVKVYFKKVEGKKWVGQVFLIKRFANNGKR